MAAAVPQISGVPVWSPDGELVRIPALDQQALMHGYRPATPEDVREGQVQEQYGGFGQGAAAFGEGAASALTFGLAPKAETALGITTPEAIEGRKEVHPIAHGLGTAAGVIAPLILAGPAEAAAQGVARGAPAAAEGAGLLSRAARYTAPGLISRAGHAAEHLVEGAGLPGALGRILPSAALGATEGGLYGGSEMTERALLGDPQLTWEKAASEIGLSALFGGALGGGGKALADLIPDNLGEKMGDWLGETAARRNVKAAGAIQSDINRALRTKSQQELDKMGLEFGERGLVGPLSTFKDTLTKARALAHEGRQEAQTLTAAADAVPGAPRWSFEDLRGEIEPLLKKELRAKGSTIPVAEQLTAKLDDFSRAYQDRLLSISDLHALRTDIDHSIYQYGRSLDPFVKPVAAPLKKVRDFLADTLENAMEDTGVGKDAWQEAMRKQEVGILAASFAKRGILREAGNNPVPLTSILGAVAGGSAGGGPFGALAAGAGTYLGRKYGSGIAGWAAAGARRAIQGGEKEAAPLVDSMFSRRTPGPSGPGGVGGARVARLADLPKTPQGEEALGLAQSMDEDAAYEAVVNGTEVTGPAADQVVARLLGGRGSEESIASLYRMAGADQRPFAGRPAVQMRGLFDRIARPDGGFTYSPTLGTEPVDGYALSIHPERSVVLDADKIQLKDLAAYVAKNRDLLGGEGNHFGAWHDPASGKVFLDVSTVVNDPQIAERLARDHDQLAYFDLKRGQSVNVAREGAHAGPQTAAAPVGALGRAGEGPAGAGSALREADRPQADVGGAGGSTRRNEEVLAGALTEGQQARRPDFDPENAAGERLARRAVNKTYDVAKDRAEEQAQQELEDLAKTEDLGADTRVITPFAPRGEAARYALVESNKLIPSHDPESFRPNPLYPAGVQERPYHLDKNERLKVENGARDLNPQLVLSDSPTPVDGPPLVTPGKHIVLGGNGRTMMMLRAFKDRIQLERYKDALRQRAPTFGFDGAHINEYDEPVLVRIVGTVPSSASKTDMTAAVRRFNEGMTQSLSPAARAVADARALSPETLNSFGTMLGTSEESSLRDLMREQPQQFVAPLERDGIIHNENRSRWIANGELTDEGKDRVEGMFLGRVLGTGDRFEATPPSVRGKVERTVPYLLAVASINPEADEIGTVREAVDLLSEARRRGLSLGDLLSQRSLFGESTNRPESEEMAKLLDALGPRAIGQRFQQWAQLAATDPRQTSMFGGAATPEQLEAVLFGGTAAPGVSAAPGLAPTGAHQRILSLSQKSDRKLKDASEDILSEKSSAGEKFAHGGLVTQETYPDVASSLRDYGSNLDRLAQTVSEQTSSLRKHAPATADAATSFASRVVQHLAPRLPDAGQRQLLDLPYEPGDSELAAYNRHHEIAMRGPVAVLEHLARGTLRQEHMQASSAIYPRLHAHAQQLVTEKLAEHLAQKKSVPLHARSALALFLGRDLEHSQTPAAVLSAQLTYANDVGAAPPAAAKPASSRSRNVETHLDQRAATASQGNETRMRKA